MPVELLLSATVTVLAGSAALPLASCVCTVICGEQTPAATLNGAVVNTSLLAVNFTVACCVIGSESVASVAEYTTVCAVESVTVNVTTPVALDGPLAAEIVELPLPAASVTVFPLTGFPLASFSVTVIVDAVAPSATTVVGLALTVDVDALTAPVVIVSVCVGLLVTPPVAAAVITGLPACVSS